MLWLVGCVAEPVGAGRAPIVGGEAEEGAPAVVALVNTATGGLCTATVVSPWIVLTAKHCVQSPGAEGPSRAADFVVTVGPSVLEPERTHEVARVATTPGTWDLTEVGGTRGALVNVDVAVLTLREPTDLAPAPIHPEVIEGLPGGEVTVIGYGRTPDGDNAHKYRTTATLTTRSGNVLIAGAAVCTGDSGGPVLNEAGELIAVVSLGPARCGDGPSAFNVIGPFLDLVDAAHREAAACDPLRPLGGCPAGHYCAREGCAGICTPGAPGGASFGAPCETDTDCASTHCVDPGDGRRRCLASCRGDAGDCLEGEACAAVAGACGACVDAALVTPRRLGEPCRAGADCVSGTCRVATPAVRYCTAPCGDGCPAAYACVGGRCLRGDEGVVCRRDAAGTERCGPARVPSPGGGGGCSTASPARPLPWPLLLLLLPLLARKR